MKLLAIVSLLAALAAPVAAVSAADDITISPGVKTWGYKNNDPNVYGPAEWGTQYPTCAGKRQSPIDIAVQTACRVGDKKKTPFPLKFAGTCTDYKLQELADAHKGEVQNGTCTVSVADKTFSMLQFHLHAPSEHTLDGKVYDAEAHFVHRNADSSALLVVGVFLEKKAGAKTDPWLNSVWTTLETVNSTTTVAAKLGSYASLLTTAAKKKRAFNYPGSLTTPGCAEIVDWWVLETPLQVSPADFDTFQAHLKRLPATDKGRGARPVQPLNGRSITVYN